MPSGFDNDVSEGQTESFSDIHARLRSLAIWVGWIGTATVVLVIGTLFLVDEGSTRLMIVAATYVGVFQAIVFAGRRDIHVRSVLNFGLTLVYFVFWVETFIELYNDESLVLALLLSIVIPVLVIAILSHQIIFALIPVQFLCMFVLTGYLDLALIWSDVPGENLFVYRLSVAGLSALMFLVLGIVSSERDNADTKLVAMVSRQEKIASTDPLTGLLNRRSFMNRLERIWSAEPSLTLAFIDLDHFKPLNDQYGHATGDEVLKQVAARLRQVPETEAVARLGGDEFAAVFGAQVSADSLELLISQLHSDVTAEFEVDARTVSLGASIGHAARSAHTDTLSKLLGAADAAMRRAKSTRTGWARFDKKIDGAALASSTLKVSLNQAIRERKIRAALQPIARADNFEIIEYELLARWPDSGLAPDPTPDTFVYFAEQLGLLNEILWMTLEDAAKAAPLRTTRLALNVSPAQLLASGFIDRLLETLEQVSIPPSRVTMEITEEVAFRNLEQNVRVLNSARDAGFLIAMDDFGSGYSSLSMLDSLPLDKLKIDQSLLKKSEVNERSADILNASVKLAKQLDLLCCVEGAESESAAGMIRDSGADEVQGYWIGRPLLVRDLEGSLKRVS